MYLEWEVPKLKISDKVDKKSRIFKIGKPKFKLTKFIVGKNKNIHDKFKSIQRSKKAFWSTLQSGNVFPNIRVYPFNSKSMAFVSKRKMLTKIGHTFIAGISIRKVKSCLWSIIRYFLYPVFIFIIWNFKSYNLSWFSCYKGYQVNSVFYALCRCIVHPFLLFF